MAKYLDQTGLNYLWQKIKTSFVNKAANLSGATGKVVTWLDDSGLHVGAGNTLGRDVAASNKFADEITYQAGGSTINLSGASGNILNIPFAANGTNGVVTTTSDVSDVTADTYHAVPIVNGVPYYNDTVYTHPTITTGDTSAADTLAFGGTFEAITGYTTDSEGHLTEIEKTTFTMPSETTYPNMVSATGTLSTDKVVLGASGKGVKESAYAIGGTALTGASGLLATEQAVKGAIDAIPAATVTGVTGNVLSLNNTIISTTLGLNFDSSNKKLQLTGITGIVDEIDASAFVKDGMMEAAGFYRYNASGATGAKWVKVSGDDITIADDAFASAQDGHEYIVMKWNEDGPSADKLTFIDALGLVDDYTAGDGIDITSRSVSVKIDPASAASGATGLQVVELSAGASGLKAEVDLSSKVDKSSVVGASGTNTASWEGKVTVGSADGKEFYFTMPAEPVSHEALNQSEIDAAITAAEAVANPPQWPSAS